MITLLKDIENYDGLDIDKEITLDFNGYTWMQPSSASHVVKANVTFTDSVGGGTNYGLYIESPCTFEGRTFRYIRIDEGYSTTASLADYLGDCCDYYDKYSDALLDLSDATYYNGLYVIINLPIFSYMPQNLIESELNVYIDLLNNVIVKTETGIEDGTAVKFDGEEVFFEVQASITEEIIEEYGESEFCDFINGLPEESFDDKWLAIYEFATSLPKEGSVAENAGNIDQIRSMFEELYAGVEKCLAGTHSYNYEVTSSAECGINAKETGICAVCGETDEREIINSALSHSFTKYEELIAPECGKAGLEKAFCDHGCGETDEQEIPALEHSFSEYLYNEDADCEHDGTKTAVCDNGCGVEDTVVAEGTKLGHVNDDNDEYCDHCGEKVRCSYCGDMHRNLLEEIICLFIEFFNLVAQAFRIEI